MANQRPYRPKGQSSHSSRPGQRPRPGSGPAPRHRSSGKPVATESGPKPKAGPARREQTRGKTGVFPSEPGKPERLQKILAQAGLGSRRGCEELVLQGRVTVNGEIVRQLGTKVDPAASRIAVDGEPIRLEKIVYFAVNKPKGYVSTNFDPSGRPRVVDLLPEIPERVYTVGRLDEDSTGLMILTNDGELANRLAHPRFGVEKMYRALVAGTPELDIIAKLTEGVWLSDGKVRAKRARLAGRHGQATMLELVLAEGKKREIRRMLAKLGHKVMSLNRVAVGPITLKGLAVGECRPLSNHEIELLRKVASGIAVSVPGFPESDGSRRTRRDAQRGDRSQHREQPRPAREETRRARDEDAGERRPPRRPSGTRGHSAHEGPQPARSQQRRPPTSANQAGPPPRGPRGRAAGADQQAGPPVRGPRGRTVDSGPQVGPAPRGPRARTVDNSPPVEAPTGPPAGSSRPPGGSKRPPVGLKRPAGGSKRPTIRPGPPKPEEAPRSRLIIGLDEPMPPKGKGPTVRKRPTARKPKPARGALGPRLGPSSYDDDAGDDEQ
ncbi:MAG: pseudouridine synthase [Isosphaeraceae bacterium]